MRNADEDTRPQAVWCRPRRALQPWQLLSQLQIVSPEESLRLRRKGSKPLQDGPDMHQEGVQEGGQEGSQEGRHVAECNRR